jgi:hypothetical protein
VSKVAIEGNASGTGTLTIAAPNTNTNRTLNLPDDTGTIVTNSGNQAGSFTTLAASSTATFAAGAVGTPAITTTGDTNTGIFFPAADTIAFAEGGAEAMRIDSSGQLMLGTATSTNTLSVDIQNKSASSNNVLVRIKNTTNNEDCGLTIEGESSATTRSYQIGINTALNVSDLTFSGPTGYRFLVGATTITTINSNGDLLLGTTGNLYGATRLQSTSASATGSFTFQGTSGNAGYEVGQIWKTNTSGDNKFLAWITEGGAGTERGSVTYNRAGNLVSYNTSSDYRLKENIIDLTDALETVARLQPRTFTWKETGNTTTGFIAHELAEVLPHAVTGEKDETETRMVQVSPAVEATHDEEGNELTPAVEAVYEEREVPKYQGVDTSFLVATLTAAIQELKAELDQAKTRIAALENNNA